MEENLIHGLSGAISSMIATGILHPFESLRTKMQAEIVSVYFIDYARKIYKEEGLKGIYSGFSSSVINVTISYAMYFFSYKMLRTWLLKKKPQLTFLDDAYASFLSSVIVIVINTPLWTINTRLVKDKSKRFLDVCKQILNREGIAGFFKGASLSILLTINPVIQYSLYEFLKVKSKSNKTLHFFLFGAISKFIATVFTYPILTLRTRQQLNEAKNKSLLEELFSMFQGENNLKSFLALYNGFFSKAVQTVLNSAIILTLHEKISKVLTEKIIKVGGKAIIVR